MGIFMSWEGGVEMKKNLFAKQGLNTLNSGVNNVARRACYCSSCSCGKQSTTTIKNSKLAYNLTSPGI